MRTVAFEEFDPVLHEAPVLGMLSRMRGQSYPGPVGGSSRAELKVWLERVLMESRWVAVASSGRVLGHVGLALGGGNGVLAGVGSQAGEVVRLFVDPEARGLGVGFQLLEFARERAVAEHGGALLLVCDYLVDAIALYESCGWVQVAEKTSAVSGDRLLVFRAP